MAKAHRTEIKALIREAQTKGWAVRGGGDRHYTFVPPTKGVPLVVVSASPSDNDTMRIVLSTLRRSGW